MSNSIPIPAILRLLEVSHSTQSMRPSSANYLARYIEEDGAPRGMNRYRSCDNAPCGASPLARLVAKHFAFCRTGQNKPLDMPTNKKGHRKGGLFCLYGAP